MLRTSRKSKVLLAFACALLCSSALLAQSLTSGDLSGTVTDPSSAGVPDAAVTASNRATGAMLTAKTNAQGFYRFAFVPPGQYTVEVKAGGFTTVQRITDVQVGQATVANIQLPLATATQTVEVSEAIGGVQVENADVTTNINTEQVQFLPNSGNDMTYIALIAPGTVISTSSGYGNFTSYGLPATANLFTLNGQNDNDIFFNIANSGASNLMLGANEISEATVVNNGYSGQYGQLAGSQVNYVTKSGKNNFHGDAEWFWNGRFMNANDWFNNQTGTSRPFANANQWATSVGGPIKKNKAFFFVDYEGLKNILPTSVLAKVPSPQFQAATLANLSATGQTAAVPFYQTAFALYNSAPGVGAATPVPGGGCGTFTKLGAGAPCALQFRSTAGNRTSEYLWATRVDYNFSEKDQAYIRLWRDKGTQPTYTDPIAPIFNTFSPQPQMQGQVSETHTFGATAVNQAIFSAFYYSARFGPPDENAVLAAFPTTIAFSGTLFSNMGGHAYNFPQGRNVQQFQGIDDFSKTFSHHTIKAGFNYRHYALNDFNFGVRTHGLVTERNLADFFAGGGTGNNVSIRFPTATAQWLSIWQLGGYLQDEVRATRQIRLTLSLRADHDSNPACKLNCFARLVAPFTEITHDPNQPYNAIISPSEHQAYTGVDKIIWQPRIGFAWTPTQSGNTVLRGGFGIFENSLPGQTSDAIARNTPQLNSFTVTNAPITPGAPGNLFALATAANETLISAFNSGGTIASIKAANPFFSNPNFTTTDRVFRTPIYYEWNFEFQQALGWKTTLSLNYVGNHGYHETLANNGLNAYGFPGLPAAAPDPRFNIVTQYTDAAVSNYNGLTVGLKRRFSGNFLFGANYTWSHALDVVSNSGLDSYDLSSAPSIINPVNPYNVRQFNYGNADYDVRHYVNVNYVWQDLFRRLTKRGPSFIAGGWNLAGTLFYRTGLPFTVVDSNISTELAGKGFGGMWFAQQVGPAPTKCGKSAIDNPCFADDAFTDPATFASQNRNQFRGPGYFDTDLSVLKDFVFPKWESARLSIGAQFFNLLNHPNFDKPVNDFAGLGSGFGQIQSTVAGPTSVYGSFVGSAVSGRLIQVRAQFVF